MAERDFIVTRSETHVAITIKKKIAERMAVILDDAGDWIGNLEPMDMGMSFSALEAAENDIAILTSILRNR